MKKLLLVSTIWTCLLMGDLHNLPADTLPQEQLSLVSQQSGYPACDNMGIGCPDAFSVLAPQFDPTLGTLDTVSWFLTDTQTTNYGYNNSSCQSCIGEQQFSLSIGHYLDSQSLSLALQTTTVLSGLLDMGSNQIGSGIFTDTVTFSLAGSANPQAFIGNGTTPLSFLGLTGISASPTIVSPATTALTDNFNLTISYNYTPVPEPSTFAFTLLGLVLIVSFEMRRSRVADK